MRTIRQTMTKYEVNWGGSWPCCLLSPLNREGDTALDVLRARNL